MAISSPLDLIDNALVFYSAGCGFESRRGRVMCATDMRASVVSHLRNTYQRLVARWARTTCQFERCPATVSEKSETLMPTHSNKQIAV